MTVFGGMWWTTKMYGDLRFVMFAQTAKMGSNGFTRLRSEVQTLAPRNPRISNFETTLIRNDRGSVVITSNTQEGPPNDNENAARAAGEDHDEGTW
jgi:hypothetical protein